VVLARFFAEMFSPGAAGLAHTVTEGAASVPGADDAVFAV